jgi:hypothetical protein
MKKILVNFNGNFSNVRKLLVLKPETLIDLRINAPQMILNELARKQHE